MTAVAAPDLTEQAGALAGRLFESTLATMELETVYLGLKLGLYEALARPATSGNLAAATGLVARYVREWCEQQAVAGFLEVDDPAADPDARVFSLPAAHALVLTEPSSPVYAAPMALLVGGAGAVMPAVLDAWRHGRGMSFAEYGDDVRVGQGGFNWVGFDHELAQSWVPAMPDVEALLRRPDARVARGAPCRATPRTRTPRRTTPATVPQRPAPRTARGRCSRLRSGCRRRALRARAR